MLAKYSEIKNPLGQNEITVYDHRCRVVKVVIRRICYAPIPVHLEADRAFIRLDGGAYFLSVGSHGEFYTFLNHRSCLVRQSQLK